MYGLDDAAFVAIIVGLSELIKRVGVPVKWIPLVSVVCPAKAGVFSRSQSCRSKSHSSVAWIAGWRETKILKPIDPAIYGMAASFQAVAKANA